MKVQTQNGSYEITIMHGALSRADEFFNLDRKVLIVTDYDVPAVYAKAVAARCKQPFITAIPSGERSKSLENYKILLTKMVEKGFTRSDCVVAVGGGVVGDLAGFVAASFMRGVDFYNIPTTVLSQVDSSVGGKTAIDFCGLKNIVGAFWPPKGVLIDPDTLKTLSPRQISNGLAEAVKMAATCDAELFSLFERDDFSIEKHLDLVITRAVAIKKSIVEQDEKESGLRRVLNFGHTLAHGVESKRKELFHGECVAIGMVPMCSVNAGKRLVPVLLKLGLPTRLPLSADEIIEAMSHDKKRDGDKITIVYVPEIGRFEFKEMDFSAFAEQIKRTVQK